MNFGSKFSSNIGGMFLVTFEAILFWKHIYFGNIGSNVFWNQFYKGIVESNDILLNVLFSGLQEWH